MLLRYILLPGLLALSPLICGTPLPTRGVRAFEDILHDEIQLLQLIYGRVKLRHIGARVTASGEQTSSDAFDFNELVIDFTTVQTQQDMYSYRTRQPNGRYVWSNPRDTRVVRTTPLWDWSEKTSTLAEQLQYLKEKNINDEFQGIIVYKLDDGLDQLVWCFVLPDQPAPPYSYTQGDRDHQIRDDPVPLISVLPAYTDQNFTIAEVT